MQRHFPIDDVLLLSGDIHDQVAKLCKIMLKFWFFFGPPNFAEKEPTKLLIEFYKSGSLLEHVAKSGDDHGSPKRPRILGGKERRFKLQR